MIGVNTVNEDFVIDLDERRKNNEFIKVRENIEHIIWNYDYLIQQINRRYRSAQGSYLVISDFIWKCMELLNNGKSEAEAIESLIESHFNYLTLDKQKLEETSSKNFDTDRKSAVYIRDAVDSAPKCNICKGLIHKNSISVDHVIRKADGGLGTVENGQLTHPYCNTGFKS